jgi:hypothetical protein
MFFAVVFRMLQHTERYVAIDVLYRIAAWKTVYVRVAYVTHQVHMVDALPLVTFHTLAIHRKPAQLGLAHGHTGTKGCLSK